MKTMKSILITALLISASVVLPVSAQERYGEHEFDVAIGDSVMIKLECVRYSTGERPSSWVWDKVHTVRQLGTKRHPDGVLLMDIYSWICDTCLTNVNGRAREAAEQAALEQAANRAAFEQALNEGNDPYDAVEEVVSEQSSAEESSSIGQAVEEVVEPEIDEDPAVYDLPEPVVEEVTQMAAKHNYHRFTIGARGGASALMHHTNQGKWTCGVDALLDLQYAHYWAKTGRPIDLGIIAGISVGYQQSGLRKDSDLTTFRKGEVDYTVLARDVKETDHQLQLEVPVMFSLILDNGLFFNVGPKFMIPVYTPYRQTVNQEETHISAYFEETGITVTDKTVTGVYTGQQPTEENGIKFNINVMVTAEIGYEWTLNSGNSLGFGAYANYSVFSSYKNTPSEEGLFNLTAPTDTEKAHLDVLSATHAYTDKLGYFDAGIKLAYHFNFPKKAKR